MLVCALTVPFALSACDQNNGPAENGDDNEVTDLTDDLQSALAQLISEGNVTPEIQIFVAHYKDFTLKDGKYTCAELASVNGFTCQNIEIALEDKKISTVKYELRTPSKDTPDRLVTIDKNGVTRTDIPKPTDDKPMDEEEWTEQATVFADVTNYTLERVRVETGEYVASMKLDGSTYYEEVDGSESIFDAENNKFYRYYRAPQSTEWVKTEVDERRYTSYIGTPSLMVTVAAQAVQENFSKFTFDAGVYTAEELKVEYYAEFTLKDMEITVSGGKIVRAVCILVGGYDDEGDERITVDYIGSTEIGLPEKFTDNTVSTPSTGGTAEMNAENWKKQFSSSNFKMKALQDSVVSEVTVSVDGNNFELVQVSSSMEYDAHNIFIENNGNYDIYTEMGDQWMKLPSQEAADNTSQALQSYKSIFALFADDFASFTLKDGKYVCAKLSKTVTNPAGTAEATCTDIEVVFGEKGELVSVKFVMSAVMKQSGEIQTSSYEFTNVGTTVVNAPEKYVDPTAQK